MLSPPAHGNRNTWGSFPQETPAHLPILWAAHPKRQQFEFYGSASAGLQGRNRISHFSACQLSLLTPFIPGTSLTLPNKHKGPHKSDLQRFIPLQGTAHQLAPVKSTQTSAAGGNLVCLLWALVPDTPESSQTCCLLQPWATHDAPSEEFKPWAPSLVLIIDWICTFITSRPARAKIKTECGAQTGVQALF